MTIRMGDTVKINVPGEWGHGQTGKVLTEPTVTGRMIVDTGAHQWYYYPEELEKVETVETD